MSKPNGISLTLSQAERGLWYDSDRRQYNDRGWGITVKLLWGRFARPVPRFRNNPWKTKPWFTIRLPFIVLPFISIAVGRYGFYIGGKIVDVDADEPWANPNEYGTSIVTISATTRRTRWK